jgi:hypothetical protein
MRGTSRQKELEALWERNRAMRKELSDLPSVSRMKELQGLPVELRRPYKLHGAPRPKSLRGPALVTYLMQLSRMYPGDKRFDDCINALFEHGIVDSDSLKFTDMQGSELDSYNQRQVSDCLAEVRLRMKQGMWERQACMEVAAERGLPGNSFTAAFEQLRHLCRSSGK